VDASYKKILWRSNIFSVKSVNLAEGDKRLFYKFEGEVIFEEPEPEPKKEEKKTK
jgi:hypothetical protein